MEIKDFEFEFCIKREFYCEAYKEDGSLWDLKHKESIECLHKIFKEKKEFMIMQDINAIVDIFISKDDLIKSIDNKEFEPNELEYILCCIKRNHKK